MWLQFFMALPVFFVLLYVPGFLVSSLLASDFVCALATAPLVASCAYSLTGIFFEKAGIPSTWMTVIAPLLVLGLVGQLVARLRRAPRSRHMARRRALEALRPELVNLLLYVAFGAAICLVYFIKPLDGPASFTWRTDNCHHLNLIARFVNTNEWSMRHASLFENPSTAGMGGSYYYPAGWHVLVCLIASALGLSAPFAANVANAVLIAFSVPTSGYLLVRTSLSDKPLAVRLGAVFPLAFGVYPWHIIIPEGRSPFFLGLMFAIVVVALFVKTGEDTYAQGLGSLHKGSVILVLVGLMACGLAHPSGVFSAGVLLVPYLVWLVWRLAWRRSSVYRCRNALLAVAVLLLAIAGVWAFCYNVPLIHSMGSWVHAAYKTRREALLRVAYVGFKDVPAQRTLAMLVWIGVAYSIYRVRYLWLTGGFLSFSYLYFLCATTDGTLKRWLATFWYSDFNRIAASASLVGVPLAALGLYAVVRIFQRLFELVSVHYDATARRFTTLTAPVLMTLLFALTIYYPSYHLPHEVNKVTTGFGYVAKMARQYNKVDNNILAPDEQEFLKKVKKITGDDTVVNFVFDGSAYAYALSDVNVFIRRFNAIYYTEEAKYIVQNLNELANDAELQKILSDLDIHYVLLLDIDEKAEGATIYEDGYDGRIWCGITRLDDNTPGFEVLLSEGDMRLYEIVDEAA